MRIRIACGLDSLSWAGFWKNDRAAVRAVRKIQYNNLLFYLLFIIFIIYYSSDSPSSLITESVCLVGKGRLKERCGLEPPTNFFLLRNEQKLVRIRFGCGLDSRIYGVCIYIYIYIVHLMIWIINLLSLSTLKLATIFCSKSFAVHSLSSHAIVGHDIKLYAFRWGSVWNTGLETHYSRLCMLFPTTSGTINLSRLRLFPRLRSPFLIMFHPSSDIR